MSICWNRRGPGAIGWSWGFGLAGIGMVLGLLIFIAGRPALQGRGEPPTPLARPMELRLQGIGIAFILAGMLSLAFLGFSGML